MKDVMIFEKSTGHTILLTGHTISGISAKLDGERVTVSIVTCERDGERAGYSFSIPLLEGRIFATGEWARTNGLLKFEADRIECALSKLARGE